MNYHLLGKNIKETRKSLKITQEQLAEKIEVSTVFISQIENGIRKPSLETVYKISIALNTKIDTLINQDVDNDINKDIDRLIKLLDMCSPKERDFVTDISQEMIIKLLGDKLMK